MSGEVPGEGWYGQRKPRVIAVFLRCASNGKEVGFVDAEGVVHMAGMFARKKGEAVETDSCRDHPHDLADVRIDEYFRRWKRTGKNQNLRVNPGVE